MANCPKCGAQVPDGVKFCAACGAPMDAAGNPPTIVPPAPSAGSGMAPNVAAMLTYIPICLIGLICAILFGFVLDPYKKNAFVRFHAWQSLALHVALIAFEICWAIFSMILVAVVHAFAIITFPISMLVGLGALVLFVVLMLKANGNQVFKLPVIGEWAAKQAGV